MVSKPERDELRRNAKRGGGRLRKFKRIVNREAKATKVSLRREKKKKKNNTGG